MLELEISNSSVPPIKKGQWRSVKGSPVPHTSGLYSRLRGRVNGNKSLSLSHEYDADGFQCASQKASNGAFWGNPYILNLFENKKLPCGWVLPSPISGYAWSSFQSHDLEEYQFKFPDLHKTATVSASSPRRRHDGNWATHGRVLSVLAVLFMGVLVIEDSSS